MNDVQAALLWAAIEDYPGLWELEWEVNTLMGGAGGHRQLARDALAALTTSGWVTIYVAESLEGDMVEQAADRAMFLISEEQSWDAPPGPDSKVVRAGATEAGRDAYHQLRARTDEERSGVRCRAR